MPTYHNSTTVPGSLQVDPYVTFSPSVGTTWMVQHVAVSGTSPITGIVYCNVFIDNKFWFGTDHGMGDVADGTPVPVTSSQELRFVWIPDKVYIPVFDSLNVLLQATILVDQK